MQLQNDLLIRAAKGEKVERTPVWLMRQAGRILPEYRAVRNSVSGFIELAQTPELAAEVTIQPVDILKVDAAIIFSDILVIPEAMGLPYEMVEKRGPWFPQTVTTASDLKKLRIADGTDDLSYVIEAVKITKKQLDGRGPLLVFAGAPWTIFSFMVEGPGSNTFSKARSMLYNEPNMAIKHVEMLTQSTINYLKAQIAAGADLVQLFDSWAGILPLDHYETFSLKYIDEICNAITEVPVTVFAKGAFFAREQMGRLNCETIGLDWNMDIVESRRLIGDTKTLQGNLDPAALYGSDKEIERATIKMLDQFKGGRHIANLGHGVYPDTDPEKVKVFIETVKSYSSRSLKATV